MFPLQSMNPVFSQGPSAAAPHEILTKTENGTDHFRDH